MSPLRARTWEGISVKTIELFKTLAIVSLVIISTNALAARDYKGEVRDYKGEVRDYKCEAPKKPAPAPCPPLPTLSDGFYIGGGVGYDDYQIRHRFDITLESALKQPISADLTGNPLIRAKGFAGRLFAGYGKYINEEYYLGAELFINTTDADASYAFHNKFFDYSTKVDVGYGYGISFLPGFKVDDTDLVYIRLGYNWVNIQAKETATDLTGPVTFHSTANNISRGFSYGIGMESWIACNLSLRAEYTHTNYSKFNNFNLIAFPDEIHSSFNPTDNQFMLDMNFHFV